MGTPVALPDVHRSARVCGGKRGGLRWILRTEQDRPAPVLPLSSNRRGLDGPRITTKRRYKGTTLSSFTGLWPRATATETDGGVRRHRTDRGVRHGVVFCYYSKSEERGGPGLRGGPPRAVDGRAARAAV